MMMMMMMMMHFTYTAGNAESLETQPALDGLDVNAALREFFRKYYTAQNMTLAVQSMGS